MKLATIAAVVWIAATGFALSQPSDTGGNGNLPEPTGSSAGARTGPSETNSNTGTSSRPASSGTGADQTNSEAATLKPTPDAGRTNPNDRQR